MNGHICIDVITVQAGVSDEGIDFLIIVNVLYENIDRFRKSGKN